MVSLQGAAELCQLNAQLAEALESLGWNAQRLGTLQGAEALVVDSVLAGARAAREDATFKWTELTDLIYICTRWQKWLGSEKEILAMQNCWKQESRLGGQLRSWNNRKDKGEDDEGEGQSDEVAHGAWQAASSGRGK